MVIKDEIFNLVSLAMKDAIQSGDIPQSDYPKIKIEFPKEDKFGDYSSPIAMESAKLIRRNPVEIGEILKKYIERSDIVDHVDVVRPGFINIFISRKLLFETVFRVIAEDVLFGSRKKAKPQKVNIEFVSANPTGPLNVVSARAAALGDTLANLIEANGDQVDREFYINDFGNQVNLLGKSVLYRFRELKGEAVIFPEDGYHGEYIRDVASSIAEKNKDAIASISGDEEKLVEFFSQKAVDHIVSWQKEDMNHFKVIYSQWFRESSLHASNEVMKTLEELEKKSVIYEEEGKKFFKSTEYGDDKDRVVVRDDGRPTYLLADIAYHRNKFSRGYDRVIDIWGPDHHGYIARIKGAIAALGYNSENFRVLISQQVNLLSDGELVKMSKRLGIFSTMRDLVDEIGTDVSRYFFVMRSLESHLDFDLALAKKQSSENPVFYLQYAHARIASIFREAEKIGIVPVSSEIDQVYFQNEESSALLKMIAKFPDEISDAAEYLEPHRISNFLLRLAQGYHKFYFEHRILTDDKIKSAHLLLLCKAVQITIRNGLAILGVSAPERM